MRTTRSVRMDHSENAVERARLPFSNDSAEEPMRPDSGSVPRRVSLLVTCLVDQFYPEVGEAVVRALRGYGVGVDCPAGQTCCGLPHYNNGFPDEARRMALRNLDLFTGNSSVVVPSGSCGWMCKCVYPSLFEDDPWTRSRAIQFSERVTELSAFLTDRPTAETAGPGDGSSPGKVAYHHSCHALRGLGLRDEPKGLLSQVPGCEIVDLPGEDRCCGFGGSFAVKFDDVSAAILREKLEAARSSGADVLVTADAGCLMQLRGGAGKWLELGLAGPSPRCLHLAEVLAPPAESLREESPPSQEQTGSSPSEGNSTDAP